ncbi:MAG: NAD(P)H-dependent oxidoreductase [Syntrophaceae bacterium]
MATSVLLVTGSFRRLGNCEMFAKQVALFTPADHIAVLRLTDFTLRPCMGCYRCLNPEHRCQVEDDLYFILKTMTEYEHVIFSIPTYVLGPVGQFKLLADRLACMSGFHPVFGKINAVSAVFGGIESWRGVTQSMVNAVIRMMGFRLKGSAFIEAALPGESLDEVYTPVAQGLAKALGDDTHCYFPSKTLVCPSCGSDLFFVRDRQLICVLCESAGEYLDGAWQSFHDSGRFSEKGFVEHFEGWLKPKVIEYTAKREHHRMLRSRFKDVGRWITKEGKPLAGKPHER